MQFTFAMNIVSHWFDPKRECQGINDNRTIFSSIVRLPTIVEIEIFITSCQVTCISKVPSDTLNVSNVFIISLSFPLFLISPSYTFGNHSISSLFNKIMVDSTSIFVPCIPSIISIIKNFVFQDKRKDLFYI